MNPMNDVHQDGRLLRLQLRLTPEDAPAWVNGQGAFTPVGDGWRFDGFAWIEGRFVEVMAAEALNWAPVPHVAPEGEAAPDPALGGRYEVAGDRTRARFDDPDEAQQYADAIGAAKVRDTEIPA